VLNKAGSSFIVNRFEEHNEELIAVRQDSLLKRLLRIHLGPPEAAGDQSSQIPGSRLVPALFTAYRDLNALRYDFPVMLLETDVERMAVPLSHLIDELIRVQTPTAAEDEYYRRDLYQLEAAIKALVNEGRQQRLSTLWDVAAKRCLAAATDAARREVLRSNLGSARRALRDDGLVTECDGQIARRLFAHAWQLIESEQGQHARETLDDLSAELTVIIDADRMRSARATSADALRTAMGGEHAGGIDFERLSSVVRSNQHQSPLTTSRRKRLRGVLKILEAERRRIDPGGGNGKSSRRGQRVLTTADSCVEAFELLDAELQRMVELFRAVRIAQLEVENRYDEARHNAFFAAFDQEQLTPEELSGLPPLFVYLDGEALDAENKATLVEILSSELPIKLLLELHNTPDAVPATIGLAAFGGWGTSLGSMATVLPTAFVMQAPASHLPRLASEVMAGLRYQGPALYCIYTGPVAEAESMPRYLHCASAAESRAFPCFVQHPGRGTDWAQRFTLSDNPQPELAWPIHHLSYEDGDGRAMIDDIAFTVADFLAMDPRFAGQYAPVAPEAWHPNMVPLGDYLALDPIDTFNKVPYLWMINGNDTLQRVIVRRGLVAAARHCAKLWRSLQELAGIDNSHALRALEVERERLEAEKQGAVEQVTTTEHTDGSGVAPAAAPQAIPGSAEPVSEDAGAPEVATAPGPEQAYIETELCTSCNDCTDRNSMMFGYDELKQAYIKDVRAGTFRELVEAAENCPVCIIHPGKPLNPDEPDLAELMQRAAAFN
jgi:ferredoxin